MKELLLLEATPVTKAQKHSRGIKTPILNFATKSFWHLCIKHYVY